MQASVVPEQVLVPKRVQVRVLGAQEPVQEEQEPKSVVPELVLVPMQEQEPPVLRVDGKWSLGGNSRQALCSASREFWGREFRRWGRSPLYWKQVLRIRDI